MQNSFFFSDFSPKIQTSTCLEFVLAKIIAILKKIFILTLSKMLINQCAPGLNIGLSSNLWWLRSANHVNITKECVTHKEKHTLIKRFFFKRAKHWFVISSLSRKDSPWSENTCISRLEKVPGVVVSKYGHADNLLGYERVKWQLISLKKVQR